MSHRPKQVASELQRAVQSVIARGLQDPRVRGIITVTETRVSQDLRDATIMISVTPEEHQDLTLHGLRSASAHIRRQAGGLMRLRSMPALHFKIDRSSKEQAAVIAAINRAVAELPKDAADDDQSEPSGDADPETPTQQDEEDA